MELKDYQSIVDLQVQRFIEQKISEYKDYNLPNRILEVVNYSKKICDSWKRMRPYFVYLAYKACGWTQDEEVMRFGLGFEFVHNFALTHDDIFDQGETRHGVLTYYKYIATLLDSEKKDHLGMSQAVLMWDLMLSWAQEIVYDTYAIEDKYLSDARKNFQLMLNQVIVGEMMDVDNMVGDIRATTESITTKDYLKTSSYSLIRPLTTWAMLAGADADTLEKLHELGKHLGSAYQLKDDLEDLTLSPEHTNKTVFSDIQEGDQTFFTDYIFKSNNQQHIALLQSLLGKKLQSDQVLQLKEMFEVSGAINYGKSLIKEHLQRSEEIINSIEKTITHYKVYFMRLITMLQVS